MQLIIDELKVCYSSGTNLTKIFEVNSQKVPFMTMCIEDKNNKSFLAYTVLLEDINKMLINMLLSNKNIIISYDDKLLNFKTKGFVTEYIKHRLNN